MTPTQASTSKLSQGQCRRSTASGVTRDCGAGVAENARGGHESVWGHARCDRGHATRGMVRRRSRRFPAVLASGASESSIPSPTPMETNDVPSPSMSVTLVALVARPASAASHDARAPANGPRGPADARGRGKRRHGGSGKLPANHTGRIPVLEYHVIGGDKNALYTRTAESFKADLEDVYKRGYRPITIAQMLDKNFSGRARRHVAGGRSCSTTRRPSSSATSRAPTAS